MELIEDIKNGISKRVTSIYGGTFILVWLIFNWELVFSIFNFDEDCTLNEKVKIIKYHINLADNLYKPILYSLSSVVIFSILNYISFAVATFFGYRVKPWIIKMFASKRIIEKSLYNDLEKLHNDLESKYETEKNIFIRQATESENLKSQISNLSSQQAELNQKNESLSELFERNSLLIKELTEENTSLKLDNITKQSTETVGVDLVPDDFFGNYFWTKITERKRTKKTLSSTIRVFESTILIDRKPIYKIYGLKLFQSGYLEMILEVIRTKELRMHKLFSINPDRLIGYENDTDPIEYRKILSQPKPKSISFKMI